MATSLISSWATVFLGDFPAEENPVTPQLSHQVHCPPGALKVFHSSAPLALCSLIICSSSAHTFLYNQVHLLTGLQR